MLAAIVATTLVSAIVNIHRNRPRSRSAVTRSYALRSGGGGIISNMCSGISSHTPVRGRDEIDSELRLLAALRRTIAEQGSPVSGHHGDRRAPRRKGNSGGGAGQ
jgi:hypothetical protein